MNRRRNVWRDRPEAEPIIDYDPNESLEDIRDELLQDMAAAATCATCSDSDAHIDQPWKIMSIAQHDRANIGHPL